MKDFYNSREIAVKHITFSPCDFLKSSAQSFQNEIPRDFSPNESPRDSPRDSPNESPVFRTNSLTQIATPQIRNFNWCSCLDTETHKLIFDSFLTPESSNIFYKGKVIFYTRGKGGAIQFLMAREAQESQSLTRNLQIQVSKLNLIGGTKDPNESIIECASREVFEETIGIFSKAEVLKRLCVLPKEHILFFSRTKSQNRISITNRTFVFFVEYTPELLSFANYEIHTKIPEEFRVRKRLIAGNKNYACMDELESVEWVPIEKWNKEYINTFLSKKLMSIKIGGVLIPFEEYTRVLF